MVCLIQTLHIACHVQLLVTVFKNIEAGLLRILLQEHPPPQFEEADAAFPKHALPLENPVIGLVNL